jgi:hypothetical protein
MLGLILFSLLCLFYSLSLSPLGKEGGKGGVVRGVSLGPINSAQVSSVASDL